VCADRIYGIVDIYAHLFDPPEADCPVYPDVPPLGGDIQGDSLQIILYMIKSGMSVYVQAMDSYPERT